MSTESSIARGCFHEIFTLGKLRLTAVITSVREKDTMHLVMGVAYAFHHCKILCCFDETPPPMEQLGLAFTAHDPDDQS